MTPTTTRKLPPLTRQEKVSLLRLTADEFIGGLWRFLVAREGLDWDALDSIDPSEWKLHEPDWHWAANRYVLLNRTARNAHTTTAEWEEARTPVLMSWVNFGPSAYCDSDGGAR